MADPFTISAGTVFSAISTTFKLAEFCLALKEVDSENLVFLTLIARVRKDLDEAFRERGEKTAIWESLPYGKRAWIDGTILDTRRALNDIGSYVEDARIDLEQGRAVTLKHRFEWVLTNHQKFITREMALATCHQSLLAAINAMHCLQVVQTPMPPPAYNVTTSPELDIIGNAPMLMRPSRRRPKGNSRNTSQTSVITFPDNTDGLKASPISISPYLDSYGSKQRSEVHIGNLHDAQSTLSLSETNLESPTSYSWPLLPEIEQSPFLIKDSTWTVEQNELEVLSAAADALDAQGVGYTNISCMADSLRRTATQERLRRARARFGAK